MEDLKIIRLEAVGSTNDYALDLAKNGLTKNAVVITNFQSAGKGRLGKNWLSQKDKGLYCSLILQPDIEIEDLAKTTLVAGLAVTKVMERIVAGRNFFLKWPNDIFCNGKKVAGILTESILLENSVPVIVIGVGININYEKKDFGFEIGDLATSIKLLSGKNIKPETLLKPLCRAIIQYINRFEQEGFAKLRGEWTEKDYLLGKQVEMVNVKQDVVYGKSLGIDENGILLVQDSSGQVHQILSGDVRLAK